MLVLRSPEEEALEEDSGANVFFLPEQHQVEQMDLLQTIRRLQYLDVRKEIVCMMKLMNDLLMERLEPLK